MINTHCTMGKLYVFSDVFFNILLSAVPIVEPDNRHLVTAQQRNNRTAYFRTKKHTSICKFEFPRVPYFHTKNINFKSVEYCRTKRWISKVYHTSIQKYHTSVQKYHTSVQKIILPYKNNFQSTSYTQILCKMCKILKLY